MDLSLQIGKYDIRKQLGKGATGTVYLAVDTFSGKEVALKVIEPEVFKDPEFGAVYRSQFLNEASLAGKLKHPHIVGDPRRGGAGGLRPHCDGGGRRRRPVAACQRRHPAAGRRRAADRLQMLRRARLRVQRGHRPPRHQAGEHHDRAGHRGEDRRFRRCAAAQGAFRADCQHRLALLHVAGAAGGSAAHSPQRHVLPRRGAVRVAHRAEAVSGRQPGNAGGENPAPAAGAAEQPAQLAAEGDRPRRIARAGQEAGVSLRDLGRLRARALQRRQAGAAAGRHHGQREIRGLEARGDALGLCPMRSCGN